MSSNKHPELSPDSVAYAESHQNVEAAAVRLQYYVGMEVQQVRYFGITVDPEDDPDWAEHGWKDDNLDYGLELTFGNGERLSIFWMRFLESLHLRPALFTDEFEEVQIWDVTTHWLPAGPRTLSELTPVYMRDNWFGHEREAFGMRSLHLHFVDGDSLVIDLINHDTLAVYHALETAQERGAFTCSHPEAVYYCQQRKRVIGNP